MLQTRNKFQKAVGTTMNVPDGQLVLRLCV